MTVCILPTTSIMAANVGTPYGISTGSDIGAGVIKQEEGRGRKVHHDPDDVTMTDEKSEQSAGEQLGSSRKRRKSKKGVDKKFECTVANCGKSYSRAEHLYRHQLNRKFEIFIHKHVEKNLNYNAKRRQFFTGFDF